METKTPIGILALEHLTCGMRIIAKNYTKYDIQRSKKHMYHIKLNMKKNLHDICICYKKTFTQIRPPTVVGKNYQNNTF